MVGEKKFRIANTNTKGAGVRKEFEDYAPSGLTCSN
jgi:hypothetical protein